MSNATANHELTRDGDTSNVLNEHSGEVLSRKNTKNI